MNELCILIIVVLVTLITIAIWNNNTEAYQKRGQSDYALLSEFNQNHSMGETAPFQFKLRS